MKYVALVSLLSALNSNVSYGLNCENSQEIDRFCQQESSLCGEIYSSVAYSSSRGLSQKREVQSGVFFISSKGKLSGSPPLGVYDKENFGDESISSRIVLSNILGSYEVEVRTLPSSEKNPGLYFLLCVGKESFEENSNSLE